LQLFYPFSTQDLKYAHRFTGSFDVLVDVCEYAMIGGYGDLQAAHIAMLKNGEVKRSITAKDFVIRRES